MNLRSISSSETPIGTNLFKSWIARILDGLAPFVGYTVFDLFLIAATIDRFAISDLRGKLQQIVQEVDVLNVRRNHVAVEQVVRQLLDRLIVELFRLVRV